MSAFGAGEKLMGIRSPSGTGGGVMPQPESRTLPERTVRTGRREESARLVRVGQGACRIWKLNAVFIVKIGKKRRNKTFSFVRLIRKTREASGVQDLRPSSVAGARTGRAISPQAPPARAVLSSSPTTRAACAERGGRSPARPRQKAFEPAGKTTEALPAPVQMPMEPPERNFPLR